MRRLVKASKASIAVLALSLAAGCGPASGDSADGSAGDGDGDGDGQTDARRSGGNEFADAAPGEACERMDILFVVDNSPSMWDEQQNLAANFPAFVDVLDGISTGSGQPLDYRIAVTTTSVAKQWTEGLPPKDKRQFGEDGALLQRCDMTRNWVERGDLGLRETFQCAAKVGILGAGKEMPLEATRLALDDRVADGTNAEFRRSDALLGLVLLTDEDDCSRRDNDFGVGLGQEFCDNTDSVSEYVAALDDVSGGPGRYAIAAIAGHDDCVSSFGSAKAAPRMQELVQQVGANAVFSTICQGDLASALQDALATFGEACQRLPEVD